MGSPSRDERVRGGLLGLLIGDALGVPYEFHPPDALPPLDAIEMDPPPGFARAHARVPPGTWSDDGAQALCLLASLLERGCFDLGDFAERMVRWWREGYLAVDGRVFDIGIQTQTGLIAILQGAAPERSGPAGEWDNGNGALMRVLPLALWHRGDDHELVRDAMASSLPTHGHLRSRLCCAAYCVWARALLEGEDGSWEAAIGRIDEALARLDLLDASVVVELEVIELARAPGGKGSGYVVDCLHSVRGALEAEGFEQVVKRAIALGHDTDTTAAVAGGIAGLREGEAAIPERWRRALRGRELLDPLLERLLVHVGA